jgi:hypothetical protein
MKTRVFFQAMLLLLLFPGQATAMELRTTLGLETRLFFQEPAYDEQKDTTGSSSLNLEIFHQFDSGSSITVEPFYRIDSSDPQRSHGDLRVCNYLYPADRWQVVIGFDKVFWGVTEFVHLVDIINQTDTLESIDGEEKLGQPMLHLSTGIDWGTIELFMLPYFRTRASPGKKGRLRGPEPIDSSHSEFESSAEQNHLDFALRYSHTLGGFDIGVAEFIGTSREPAWIEKVSGESDQSRIPYYQQISQTSIDLQYISGAWLWKVEALYRLQQERNSGATVFGLEYTIVNPWETSLEIGLVGEYVYDDRTEIQPAPYENDLMLGVRLNMNDAKTTELLLGLVLDTQNESTIITMEASRRLHDGLKLELCGALLNQIDETDPAYSLHRDSFVMLKAIFYY